MSEYVLYLGNKNYSSWSMRAWLALKACGVDFEEVAFHLYLAEQVPDAGLWPRLREARAVARSVCAEMHSGFQALRTHMPFNVRRSSPGKGRGPGVEHDIERVCQIWNGCRSAFGGDGSFLFGRFGLADIFFAPVVTRFKTYAVEVDQVSSDYASAILGLGHVIEWYRAAHSEEWVEPQFDL